MYKKIIENSFIFDFLFIFAKVSNKKSKQRIEFTQEMWVSKQY